MGTVRNYASYVFDNLSITTGRHEKVIDIGSGHSPLIRADVLCDKTVIDTVQRPVPSAFVVPGRFVLGDILELPFQEKAFDFAYCKNILEHVGDPVRACAEMSRIARRGLIRAPSHLWEIMGGSRSHLWLISCQEKRLIFTRKAGRHVRLNSQIPERVRNSAHYERLFRAFPDLFYVEHSWEDSIEVEKVFEEDESDTYSCVSENSPPVQREDIARRVDRSSSLARTIRLLLFEMLRRILGGRNIDLYTVIACPVCKCKFTDRSPDSLGCRTCRLRFPIICGVPLLTRENGIPLQP